MSIEKTDGFAIPIDLGIEGVNPEEEITDPAADPEGKNIDPTDPPAPDPKKPRGRPKKDPIVPDNDPTPDPEPAPEDDEEQNESIIQALASKWGIEFEEGEEYEDTEEGLEQFLDTVADRRAENNFQSFMEQYPEASEYFDFIAMGGKKEDFFKASNPEIDYNSLDLTKEEVQKAVMRAWYRKNDFNTEEAEEAVNDLLNSGILDKNATKAAEKLSVMQSKEKETLIATQKAKAQEQQVKIEGYWREIDKTVKAGTVKGFVIPEKDRKATYEYMSKAIAPGKSQEMLDDEKMDYETRIALAFLKMKKFDLNGLIQKAASTQQAKSLTERLKIAEKMKSSDIRTTNEGLVIPEIDLKYIGHNKQ